MANYVTTWAGIWNWAFFLAICMRMALVFAFE